MLKQVTAVFAFACAVAGCASLKFGNHTSGVADGMVYYDPIPHLLVTCGTAPATSVVMLPDTQHPHFIRPGAGYGAAKQSATVTNGILTTFNQETDPQMQHLGALLTAAAAVTATGCEPGLFRISTQSGVASLTRVSIPE